MAERLKSEPLTIDIAQYEDFIDSSRFVDLVPIGFGANGLVFSATDSECEKKVALKKLRFHNKGSCRRTLREINLTKSLSHKNVIKIYEILGPDGRELTCNEQGLNWNEFKTVYLVQELLQTDMNKVIQSRQLSNGHIQYFLYQLLKGIKYIHSANVVHRDLKPSNLLVDCESLVLKIGDFSLARVIDPQYNHRGYLTENIGSCWYRAPELILSPKTYTKSIDMWSVGCIFAEMLDNQVLFPGAHEMDQMCKILDVIHLSDSDWTSVLQVMPNQCLNNHPLEVTTDLKEKMQNVDPAAIDLLEKLLTFNPSQRLTAEEALNHPYLKDYAYTADEPIAKQPFQIEAEVDDLPPRYLKQMILDVSVKSSHSCGETFAEFHKEGSDSGVEPLSVLEKKSTSGIHKESHTGPMLSGNAGKNTSGNITYPVIPMAKLLHANCDLQAGHYSSKESLTSTETEKDECIPKGEDGEIIMEKSLLEGDTYEIMIEEEQRTLAFNLRNLQKNIDFEKEVADEKEWYTISTERDSTSTCDKANVMEILSQVSNNPSERDSKNPKISFPNDKESTEESTSVSKQENIYNLSLDPVAAPHDDEQEIEKSTLEIYHLTLRDEKQKKVKHSSFQDSNYKKISPEDTLFEEDEEKIRLECDGGKVFDDMYRLPTEHLVRDRDYTNEKIKCKQQKLRYNNKLHHKINQKLKQNETPNVPGHPQNKNILIKNEGEKSPDIDLEISQIQNQYAIFPPQELGTVHPPTTRLPEDLAAEVLEESHMVLFPRLKYKSDNKDFSSSDEEHRDTDGERLEQRKRNQSTFQNSRDFPQASRLPPSTTPSSIQQFSGITEDENSSKPTNPLTRNGAKPKKTIKKTKAL